MAKVVNLQKYRAKKKKAWSERNQLKLLEHVREYLHRTMPVTFVEASHAFQRHKFASYQQSWDYTDLRESIEEALTLSVSEELYQKLLCETWFDPHLISPQDLVELCLREYILAENCS
ncbi:MAG: hypothetical protein OXT67_09655 [Zetaproteobacteria bacterium]|nr:hypothetical protein [Zetaproteobacteria bacterium]